MKRANIRGVRIIRESYEPPGQPYSVDHFHPTTGSLIYTLGRYPDLDSARAAFRHAVRHRPQRHLCLRNGAQVIAKHEPGGS
jgi:hypothetical protein